MGYFGAFGFHPKSTGGGGGSGSVTAVGAGTGMNFPTITGTGNVAIDTTKVPYYPAGFINGLAKWNGITWVFDNTNYYPSSNPSGYITGITSADITTALGFTPYSNSNPSGYISGITSSDVTTALGFTPYNASNPSGYISGITGIDVTTALGYTPYNSSNPSGYISVITGLDITTALGYTPYDSANPAGYISSITGLDVTTALGYTPYNSTNPAGYISSITSGDVTTALGYTPVNISGDTMTGFLILNSNPTNPLGAATKQYVDNLAGNVNFHSPTYAASTTNLVATYLNGTLGVGATLTATSNGALNLDGVDFSLLPILPQPYRVLIWQQSNQIENGIYDVTQVGDAGNPFILTRSDDADNSPTGELTYGDFSLNQNGTLYGGYGFIMNATGTIIIGTSNVTYVQYNVAQAITAGFGLQELTPNVLSVDSSVILTVANAATIYYPLTNPSGYISGITSGDVTTALGYTPYNSTNPSGYISGITSGDVTSALGYTPYNSSNPSGYISSITSGDVTTALGYTPYNATNPSGYISGITSGDVTTALGYTPYNSTNPAGYISGITSGDVTTALGYTPYDSSNPAGYITSASLSSYVPYTGAAFDLNMNSKNVITPQVFGSTVASGFLTLNSTSDATKGKIIFGTSAYDEVNNRLGIGTATPTEKLTVSGNIIANLLVGGGYVRIYDDATFNYIESNKPTVLQTTSNNAIRITAGGSFSVQTDGSGANKLIITTSNVSPNSVTQFTSTLFAQANCQASTEVRSVLFSGASKTWLNGNIDTQRWFHITANTAAFASVTSTITNSYALYVEAAIAGTNAIITNNYAAGFLGNVIIRDALTPTNPPLLNADLEVHKVRNGDVVALVRNDNQTASNIATASFVARTDSTTQMRMIMTSNSYATVGLITAGTAQLTTGGSLANRMLIGHASSSKDIIFVNGGTGVTNEIFRISSTNTIDIFDARNLTFGTTTGTKFGTSTSQKIGFFNATPIVQPPAVTTVQGLSTALSDLGLIAVSTPSIWNVTTQAGATYIASNNDYVLVNASTQTITLPAPALGRRVGVKVITSVTNIQVITNGIGITIDGVDRSSIGLGIYNQWDAYTFVSSSSAWYIES